MANLYFNNSWLQCSYDCLKISHKWDFIFILHRIGLLKMRRNAIYSVYSICHRLLRSDLIQWIADFYIMISGNRAELLVLHQIVYWRQPGFDYQPTRSKASILSPTNLFSIGLTVCDRDNREEWAEEQEKAVNGIDWQRNCCT